MPLNALTGTRIRERRVQTGLRQAELALAAGVSASYLNLIEHNRRRVAGPVLGRIAAALGVAPAALEGTAEAELVAGLREAVAGNPVGTGPERAEDLIGRFPGWAALVAAQQRRIVRLEQLVEALSDRLNHDPHLSAGLHELLSAATSVRSTAAILADTPDIEPEWRARFERNLAEDSARLARGAEALAGYLDGAAAQEAAIASPQEEFEAWAAARGWHLPEIEAGATPESVIAAATALSGEAARALARDWLVDYARDAAALPLRPVLAALRRHGRDPGRLAQALGVDPAQLFRRLGVLPPEAGAFGLVACDGSGTLIWRKPLPGFALPRFGAACALWPLYEALAQPGRPVRAQLRLAGPGGASFDSWSWAQTSWPDGFAGPGVLRAQMLLMPPEATGPAARPIGVSCRICVRGGCPARREAALIGEEPV